MMTPAADTGPARGRWRWREVAAAPHRLGFLSGMIVLAASGLWWALVQCQRAGLLAPWPMAVSPSLLHGAAMTFGFFPLFFSGFLFTAGPRWLGVRGPACPELQPLLAAQVAGWMLWLVGGHVHAGLAAGGLLLACAGLGGVTLRFWALLRASRQADRLHPTIVAVALTVGCVCIAAVVGTLAAESGTIARAAVLSGLWGCVAVVFVTVGHRMIPFFTAPPVPLAERWHDRGVLWLMVAACIFEAVAAWAELALGQPLWRFARGLAELGAGSVLVASAAAWGLEHRMHIRLMAMLHIGFGWIGVALALTGASGLLGWLWREPVLPLAGLHAFTMGALGSLMLAMVSRVSAGHGGWPVVADNLVWTLFWLLQLATLLRIGATIEGAPTQCLLAAAAVLWAALMLTWSVRYGSRYGHPAPAARSR
jgi:uncharacterized protein involved in response to NO